ncbi:TRAP transporter substrate-binding protein DctP [Pseudovibrio sp. Tun.PSC04-5.I4]|uniref:TRAP transporter substrate-binding protein DctP n=1 Tax=Pseudovibrio sp. Tun.PSC04-5.I4 TaxID=1798213 RepID=UPI00088892DC|nr:TRAP transporter substrate-binding protein DctP [Pseudovibrio sp. Tun.PSC04-5.I4]SDQ96642.1 TRAP-type C4-dicarboxylate transport system, substrate-binding protein [Pseudovibrio sp. Tun.PSC04-5.I4]
MKFRGLLLSSVLSLIASTGMSEAAKELTFATSAPLGTPWVDHMDAIAEKIITNSNAAITVKQFHAGQLGTEPVMVQKTVRGRIDIIGTSMTAFTTVVPEMALMGVPFLWDSYEQVDCAMDQYLTPVFEPLFAKKGLKFLQWSELGWVHAFGKNPLLTLGDMKALKVRAAPAKYSVNFWKGIGANGIVLPLAETPSALQTGMVDGGALPAMTYIAIGMNKLAPNLTLSAHLYQAGAVVMSMRTWKKLSKTEQQNISEALVPVQGLRTDVRQMADSMIVRYKESGGPVHELSAEQRAAWKAAVVPYRKELVSSIGGSAKDVWPKILAAKKACSQ